MKAFILVSLLLVCSVNDIAGFSITDTIKQGIDNIEKGASDVGDLFHEVANGNQPVGQNESDEEILNDLRNIAIFNLYTRDTAEQPEQLVPDDVDQLRNSHFDPNKSTKIVTHGWQSSSNADAVVLVRDAFLKHDDCNVITLDWSTIADGDYLRASNRVLKIGKYTAALINFLQTEGLDLNNLTIVGHSLGAHVAGLAARYTNGIVNYVVALDPALPNFPNKDSNNKLSRGDARYVEAIHTNAGLAGFKSQIGDVDFYANGGYMQPGCSLDISCSHGRSYQYYAESINSEVGFWAVKCSDLFKFNLGNCNSNDKALMGGVQPDYNVRGTYYFNTNSKPPYALGLI